MTNKSRKKPRLTLTPSGTLAYTLPPMGRMLILNPTAKIHGHLEKLLSTGLWGDTKEEVALRLVEQGIRGVAL